MAALNGHEETCTLLLDRGAAVDSAEKDGWTPLMVAAQNGHTETCILLLEKGASFNTAMERAKDKNNDSTVAFLDTLSPEKRAGDKGGSKDAPGSSNGKDNSNN